MLKRDARMILIDVDGTLVDSVPDLAFCVDETMKRIGRAPWGEGPVRDWVGNGVERLVKRALVGRLDGEPDAAVFDKALPIFMEIYAQNISKRSLLYPGVLRGLDELQAMGYILGCVTNKAARFTEPLLRDLGVIEYFKIVVSGDTTPKKKPDPLPLFYAAERLGVLPDESLMIGDSVNDVTAARQAGFQVVCVPYGYNHGQDIREAAPDAVIADLSELPALLRAARK